MCNQQITQIIHTYREKNNRKNIKTKTQTRHYLKQKQTSVSPYSDHTATTSPYHTSQISHSTYSRNTVSVQQDRHRRQQHHQYCRPTPISQPQTIQNINANDRIYVTHDTPDRYTILYSTHTALLSCRESQQPTTIVSTLQVNTKTTSHTIQPNSEVTPIHQSNN